MAAPGLRAHGIRMKMMWLEPCACSLTALTMGAQAMLPGWEAHSAHSVCASCRENTFPLTAWLKLDHQMASLHLSRHLIWCLWSILSRITASMWSGINIWFPLSSCPHFNIYFLIKPSKADTGTYITQNYVSFKGTASVEVYSWHIHHKHVPVVKMMCFDKELEWDIACEIYI